VRRSASPEKHAGECEIDEEAQEEKRGHHDREEMRCRGGDGLPTSKRLLGDGRGWQGDSLRRVGFVVEGCSRRQLRALGWSRSNRTDLLRVPCDGEASE
jgi:hypothetical protein